MDTVLVELYYCQLRWTVRRIAETIKKPESYVQQIIEAENFIQPEDLPVVIDPLNPVDQVQVLKDQEVAKQATLAPIYIQIEAMLLGKVVEGLEDLDTQRIDAHEVMKSYASTLQSLKQHAITTKVFDDKNTGTGIQINVIGMIS